MIIVEQPRPADTKQPAPYGGHTIILTHKFEFAYTLEGEDHVEYSASLREAHERIDAHLKRQAKQNRAKETCKLPYVALGRTAIDREPRIQTGFVKGFHASQGHVLTSGEPLDGSSWYPDTPWLREKIQRLGELQHEAYKLDQELRPFKLAVKPVYGRTSAERYDEVLGGLIKEYEKKRELAQQAAQAAIRAA